MSEPTAIKNLGDSHKPYEEHSEDEQRPGMYLVCEFDCEVWPCETATVLARIAALEAENARLRAILEQLADVYHDIVHGVENSVEAMYACKRDWFCEEARAALAASAGEVGDGRIARLPILRR